MCKLILRLINQDVETELLQDLTNGEFICAYRQNHHSAQRQVLV
jgi:hypothetical protein